MTVDRWITQYWAAVFRPAVYERQTFSPMLDQVLWARRRQEACRLVLELVDAGHEIEDVAIALAEELLARAG
jgi:hypothetical protein